MFLSIIIPIYNGSRYIKRVLDSLNNQTCKDFEVIAVDDGSTDGSIEILENYHAGYSYYPLLKTNGGVSSARNLGFEKAVGEYVLFLDVDDDIDPDFVKICKTRSDVDLIITGFDIVKGEISTRMFIKQNVTDPLKEFLKFELRIHVSSMLCKRSLLIDEKIVFNEKTYYGEDREFVIKSLFYANSWTYIPIVLFHYHLHPESVSHKSYSRKNLTSLYAIQRSYNLCRKSPYASEIKLNLIITLFKNYSSYLKGKFDPAISRYFSLYFKKYSWVSLKTGILGWSVNVLLSIRCISKSLFNNLIKKLI